jgi:hypothetical protein
MKAGLALCCCAMLLFGCSQRYGIRVLNRSTNDLALLNISWDGHEVMFPPVASASASYGDAYGAPSPDVAVYPRVRMPNKQVLISYLTPGPVTNSIPVLLSKEVFQAVRQSHGNFMFVVNADGTITSTTSSEPK